MPTEVTPLDGLAPDIDPWERQPAETIKRFNQFCAYRDAGRARTLRQTAETLTLHVDYVRSVAAAMLWTARAERWDLNRDRLHQAAWLDGRREAAQRDASTLDAASRTLVERLATLDPDDLSPMETFRGLDVVMRHRRLLYGDPVAVTVSGPDGGPLQIAAQVAEWTALSPDARSAQLLDLAESVRRRARALTLPNDDEDDD